MKLIRKDFFLSVFVVLNTCSCSNDATKPLKKQIEDSEQYVFDSSIVNQKDKSALQMFVENYADSINRCTQGNEPLPSFLSKPDFDYDNIGIWSLPHSPISLRKMIVDHITNCQCLKSVIEQSPPKLYLKPTKRDGINLEYVKLSFFDLLKRRLNELHCK